MLKLKIGELIYLPDFCEESGAELAWNLFQDGGIGGLLAKVEAIDECSDTFRYGFVIRNKKGDWIDNDLGRSMAFWITLKELGTPTKLLDYSFKNDEEKMRDYHNLSKEEFLACYSYLDNDSYLATRLDIRYNGL